MKKNILFLTIILMVCACSSNSPFYAFSVKDSKGNDVSMEQYKGKVLLIVNTATRCGFTPQYTELETLYEKYKDKGLEILDFPCNQFNEQAPESIEEIHEFCSLNFNVKFPLFDKVEVNGANEQPLFAFLKKAQGFKGFDKNTEKGPFMDEFLRKKDSNYDKNDDIKWNFTKFLVDKKGNVVARFEPVDSIEKIEEAIKKLL